MLRRKGEVLSVSIRRKGVSMDIEGNTMFIGIRELREYISLMWTLMQYTRLFQYEKIDLQM